MSEKKNTAVSPAQPQPAALDARLNSFLDRLERRRPDGTARLLPPGVERLEFNAEEGLSKVSVVLHASTARAGYNRTAAVAYTRAHWRSVATDGYIGTRSGGPYVQVDMRTQFVQTVNGGEVTEVAREPSGNEISWEAMFDCAHFVSCCIGQPPRESAGGLAIGRDFPSGPYGILGANRLFEDLTRRGFLKLVAVKTNDPSQLAQLQAGDLIFYWNNAEGVYHHVGLYMADVDKRISCHTDCRSDQQGGFPQAWNSVKATDAYTFAQVNG